MATTEHTINDALAAVLRKTRRVWDANNIVSSENTGMLKGSSKRPDILVTESNVSPVTIETEVLPAVTVEAEAMSRLGEQIRTTGRTILSSIAVRLPKRLRQSSGQQLYNDLADANDIEFALYTGGSPSECLRWPSAGWITGNIADLSVITQSASIPPDVIEKAADQLIFGVNEAAGLLHEMAQSNSAAIHRISLELRQQDGMQTRRMATTILANAFIFHDTLAGGPGKLSNVKSLEEIRGTSSGLTKSAVLAEWRNILKVNYWPIFDIARRILEIIPQASSKMFIERLAETADKLLENRLMRSHDLTGAVFQRLIVDRKFLAAYYTTPASASLLVCLAIMPDQLPAGGDWSNPDDVRKLRLADFACGTGTLLTTAYQRIGQLHELRGGSSEAIHPDMMASAITGCDVLPAAAHLTASMLAGAHPTSVYEHSSIITVAYGEQADKSVSLGSIELLAPQGRLDVVPITAKYAGGKGETEKDTWMALPHSSYDVVIMNPPFTRDTGQESDKVGVSNPMFAAFNFSADVQKKMAAATKKLTAGTSAHGNAGEASIFIVLGHRKLKTDGTLALVIPLSLMSGDAWEASRTLLRTNYSDLILVSISGKDGADLSFSADTNMGECLVVGRKTGVVSERATFVILEKRPDYSIAGATTAKEVRQLIAGKKLRRLEDGPVGGTPVCFGSDMVGQIIDAPLPDSGGWNLSRVADITLAQAAYQLASEHRIWLPTMPEKTAVSIPITTVEKIGVIGPYHADVNGNNSKGGVRGPFSLSPLSPGSAPTYPVLWSHEAALQETMLFDADSEGTPRKGASSKEQKEIDDKVAKVWATASHCHFSRDFRFNSQSTSMQFTPRKAIGGRAWLSICLASPDQEKAMVLWANTSLGLLLHWWHANKQQAGRGSIGKSSLESLAVLDVTALTPVQLKKAADTFDAMSNKKLLPLHQMDHDATRQEIDAKFGVDVLGLDAKLFASGGPVELLRMKLAREPSIRGHK